MNKFLNFSTILFSYVLITLLVISCGGSGGGGGDGGAGSTGNGGNGGVPQPEPQDKNCLLPDRADKDSFIAILCSEGVVIGKIEKIPDIENQIEFQYVYFLIPSTDNAGGTWEIPEAGEIQISHSKDYKVEFNDPTSNGVVTMADADGHTAESPLKILTMSSLIHSSNSDYNRLLDFLINFIPTSTVTTDSLIVVNVLVGLAVKTQAEFISMANFTIPPLGESGNLLRYVLANDLDLVAPGGVADKFNNAIIPVADETFDFNGGGHTITLKSAIDTTAIDKPAAIIGKVTKDMDFRNVTLNINAPISGSGNVGTIVGYAVEDATSHILASKVNINRNITVYKSADNENGYVGGLLGSGYVDIARVVVKTVNGAVIQAVVPNDAAQTFSAAVGGLVGKGIRTRNLVGNVVDVTLGAETSGDVLASYDVSLGGLAGVIEFDEGPSAANNNLVNLAISRGKLPADFSFDNVAGLVAQIQEFQDFTSNLVYADFSNLGKVNFLGGLLGKIQGWSSDISNNMIFIADSFTGSDVQTSFGAAIALYDQTIDIGGGLVLNIDNNFVSSPFTDNNYTTNAKLASFVHTAASDMTFNNLILDNTLSTVMFKAGNEAGNLQGKVSGANGGPLFTLAEAKTTAIDTLFKPDDPTNTISWEAVSEGYPQLKVPEYFSEANKADWDRINGLIQEGLAAREASQQ